MTRGIFRNIASNRLGYLMLLPAIVLFLLVNIYPLMHGIYLSLHNYNPVRPDAREFIGFDNFVRLFSDTEFLNTLQFSFIYTFSVVALSYLIGLMFALLLQRALLARGVYRTLLLLPYVVAPAVAAINWLWLLNDRIGFVNHTLRALNIIEQPLLFLATPELARLTVIATTVWRGFPFMMIVILAGLQSIPRELYESASMDGAGFWKSLWYITLPRIRSVSAVCIILRLIWTFNAFENIYLLTMGGPNRATFVLPVLTYYTAFWRNRIGYASAIAVFMLVVLVVFSVIYMRIKRNEDF